MNLHTEIRIHASPEKVWSVLTDFDTYPEWNPFIRSVKGIIKTGSQIRVELSPPDSGTMVFKPKILVLEPNRELRWLGHLLFPGIFDGEHVFQIIKNEDGSTQFIQKETFSGILVPLFRKSLNNNTKAGFEEMNNQLKTRSESRI